jgi:hypothetical protein
MNWPLIIGAALSPTRAWADHKLKLEQNPRLRKRFIQRWNYRFLIGSATVCIGVQLLEFFSISSVNLSLVPTLKVFSIPVLLPLSLLCLLLWIPFSRSNEIFMPFSSTGSIVSAAFRRVFLLTPRIEWFSQLEAMLKLC